MTTGPPPGMPPGVAIHGRETIKHGAVVLSIGLALGVLVSRHDLAHGSVPAAATVEGTSGPEGLSNHVQGLLDWLVDEELSRWLDEIKA